MAILHQKPEHGNTGRITEPNQIKMGMWATQCCHRDLYRIESQEQIDLILEDWDEDISHEVYLTKKDALLSIREGWDDPDEIKMIDIMLKELGE